MKPKKVKVFDTTLRDGAQAPGAAINFDDSIKIAELLEEIKVDVIEAGFAASSEHDRRVIAEVGRVTTRPIICSLSRCVASDIEAVIRSMEKFPERSRIHLFIATSKIHLEKKLGKTFSEVVKIMQKCVRYASRKFAEVEITAEDGGRTSNDNLVAFYNAGIESGAKIINIADTTGDCLPFEFEEKVLSVYNGCINERGDIDLSVHCHDDKGCATANTVMGVRSGANQIECVVNGIGERSGNTSLEESVMAIRSRKNIGDLSHIDTKKFVALSRFVERATGFVVPPNKAIVGSNAFSHGAGIHQDGMFKSRETYEVFNPEEVGWDHSHFPLTRHSGRHAFKKRVEEVSGKVFPDAIIEELFASFKKESSKVKIFGDPELIRLVNGAYSFEA